MTAPTNGATVAGTINTSANATDNVGVTRVEFFRDGTVLGQDTTSPYSMSVNTTTVTNGSHTFGARAYDAAGNVGNATNVTATVSNTPPCAWLQPERHPVQLHCPGQRCHCRPDSVSGYRQLRHLGRNQQGHHGRGS